MDNQEQIKIISDDLHCILLKLEIPTRLVGFNYLHYAIMQALTNPKNFRKQTDALKLIASQLHISVSAFRDAVQRATLCFWESNNLDRMISFYRHQYTLKCGVPSDFEFIIYMASYLRTKHNFI